MTSPEKPPTSAQTARRQLVRGVFAAPALLTVYSGGALAAGSAKRCLVNQTNQPTMVPVSTGLDTYVRIRLRRTGPGNARIFWVSGADLQVWKRPTTTVYLSNSQWQQFDIVNNTAGAISATPPANDTPTSGKYAALRFDANGNVVGVGGSGAFTSAVAGTCWQSVALTL